MAEPTDFEKLKALFDEWKIKYVIKNNDDELEPFNTFLFRDGEKIKGYDFYVSFSFNKEKKFEFVTIAE